MTIARSSTGKRLFDAFTDGDFTSDPTWTPAGNTPTIVDVAGNYKARLLRSSGGTPSILDAALTVAQDAVFVAKVTPRASSCQMFMDYLTDAAGNFYVIEHRGTEFHIARYVGGARTNLVSNLALGWILSETTYAFSWQGTALKAYRNGALLLNTTDASHSSLSTVRIYGGGTNSVDYVYFDDIVVMNSFNIACSGLPTGHKLRVTDGSGNTAVATESGGTATVDCSALTNWPCASVAVLDASNVIVETLTLTRDVYGGDVYTYSAVPAPSVGRQWAVLL